MFHAYKAFRHNITVPEVTFGVRDGDILLYLFLTKRAKTTLISLIRGELLTHDGRGEIFVKGISVDGNPGMARSHLGFCPQVDAIDLLTFTEHFQLYGKLKGGKNVENNVREVLHFLDLEPYANLLGSRLSGGWKRKLSMRIANMGWLNVSCCGSILT